MRFTDLWILIWVLLGVNKLNGLNFDKDFCQCQDTRSLKRSISRTSRIINGSDVLNKKDFSFIISFYQRFNVSTMPKLTHAYRNLCTGTMVNARFFLVSGLCLQNFNNTLLSEEDLIRDEYFIAAGGHDLQNIYTYPENFRRVKRVYRHPQYNDKKILNDIGLIETHHKFQFNNYLMPACFIDRITQKFYGPPIGAGFGYNQNYPETDRMEPGFNMKDYNLVGQILIYKQNQTKLKMIDDFEQDQCLSDYKGEMICVRSPTKALCLHDEGSPLIYLLSQRYYVIGIASDSAKIEKRCTINSTFNYVEISRYLKWIRSHVKDEICIFDTDPIIFIWIFFGGLPLCVFGVIVIAYLYSRYLKKKLKNKTNRQ